MVEFFATSALARFAALLAIFAIVALLAYAVMAYFGRRSATRAQLREIVPAHGNMSLRTVSANEESRHGAWVRIVETLEKSGLDLSDTNDERLRGKFIEAGFIHPSAPRIYTLVRLVLVIALPLLYVLIAYSQEEPPGFLTIYLVGSVLALLGLYIPNLYIRAKADRRREKIVNGFPDCLDLILVCVEAGLGVESAMDRVAREMVHSHPEVSELLSATVLQLRAGASREVAYKRMADRAAVDEIRSFTTLLIQTDKLGTSIATTLRVYANEMREKRRMRAEEKAYRLPVLISIPLVVFMLPTMIGVLMLPASVRMVRDIFPMMTGG